MEIRKLSIQEHGKTRELYEEVFTEDDPAFVDYYYTWKTLDNIIYAAENEAGIQGMLHLNPFLVSVNGKVRKLHYIVAVATRSAYRHQGIMRRLLAAAEQELAQNGEEFTFLMPASEQIYYPFGYRYFSKQRCGVLRVPEGRIQKKEISAWSADQVFCRRVSETEYRALADFVNQTLCIQYEVFIYRDERYYRRLCAEQQCQKGEVMVIVQLQSGEEELIGTFCTAVEGEKIILREVIISEGKQQEAWEVIQKFQEGHGRIEIQGINCRYIETEKENSLRPDVEYPERPLLMAKQPGANVWKACWNPGSVFINEVV